MNLKDKIVFITGASSGIGKTCAYAFAEKGANLIISSRSIDLIEIIAHDINDKFNTNILTYRLDVTKYDEVNSLINSLPEKWQQIDILINNAGGALGLEKLHNGDIKDWDQMIDANMKGLLYTTREIVPLMLKYSSGHIINIGSIAGVQAYANGAVYCATKAAVKSISDGLRIDLVDTPLRVTNIQPGLVETNFSKIRFHGDEKKAENVYKGLKTLTATDIANSVLYAASAPSHVQVCEITITPTNQASGTVVYRK